MLLSSNDCCSSLVIDMTTTESHASCPHTSNIVGLVDLINLILSCVSHMSVQVQASGLKKVKPAAHDGKIPQGRSRQERRCTVHTSKSRCITVHSGQPVKHSAESHLCHECVENRQQSAVCPADGRRAEHGSRTLFSCNNGITGPRAGDTGERRQQPRHAKY